VVPDFFRGTTRARGGVDLLYVMEPLPEWSSFGSCTGVGAQGVPIPLAGSWLEPWLLPVGLACGPGYCPPGLPPVLTRTQLFVGFFVAGYADMPSDPKDTYVPCL